MIVINKNTGRPYGVNDISYLTTASSDQYANTGIRKKDLVPILSIKESDDPLESYVMKCLSEGKSFEEISHSLQEGMFGSIVGGLTGFALGNKIGNIICRCLGIGNGILKDLLTSRLFGASLGAALGKQF